MNDIFLLVHGCYFGMEIEEFRVPISLSGSSCSYPGPLFMDPNMGKMDMLDLKWSRCRCAEEIFQELNIELWTGENASLRGNGSFCDGFLIHSTTIGIRKDGIDEGAI